MVEEKPGDKELFPHRLPALPATLPAEVRVLEQLNGLLYESIGVIRIDKITGNTILELEDSDIGQSFEYRQKTLPVWIFPMPEIRKSIIA